jgi:hypothetical protein
MRISKIIVYWESLFEKIGGEDEKNLLGVLKISVLDE